mmetsp:Transcript_7384/g.12023  ORF Transcript_7384/g.12023 Transcript_7384/m.12023 type:complete len:210 (-) Transcript_7384:25-654(-)
MSLPCPLLWGCQQEPRRHPAESEPYRVVLVSAYGGSCQPQVRLPCLAPCCCAQQAGTEVRLPCKRPCYCVPRHLSELPPQLPPEQQLPHGAKPENLPPALQWQLLEHVSPHAAFPSSQAVIGAHCGWQQRHCLQGRVSMTIDPCHPVQLQWSLHCWRRVARSRGAPWQLAVPSRPPQSVHHLEVLVAWQDPLRAALTAVMVAHMSPSNH